MRKLLFVGAFAAFSQLWFGCYKYPDYCRDGMYLEFDLPVTLTPLTDTLPLGDTLWVELRLPNPLLNKRDGKTYDITNANWYMHSVFSDLMLPWVVPSTDYYMVDEHGNPAPNNNPDGDLGTNVTFKQDGGEMYWKKGFVFTKRSRYLLEFSNLLFKRSSKSNITPCPFERFTLNYVYNGGLTADEKNYRYIKDIPDSLGVGSHSKEQFDKGGVFAICVD